MKKPEYKLSYWDRIIEAIHVLWTGSVKWAGDEERQEILDQHKKEKKTFWDRMEKIYSLPDELKGETKTCPKCKGSKCAPFSEYNPLGQCPRCYAYGIVPK